MLWITYFRSPYPCFHNRLTSDFGRDIRWYRQPYWEESLHHMFRRSSVLRSLLILAFCLNGSATLWQATAVAAGTVGKVQAGGQGTHESGRDASEMAGSAHHCPDETTLERGSGDLDGCACADACDCASNLFKIAIVHEVPPVGPAWQAHMPVLSVSRTVDNRFLSSVFRPPIG